MEISNLTLGRRCSFESDVPPLVRDGGSRCKVTSCGCEMEVCGEADALAGGEPVRTEGFLICKNLIAKPEHNRTMAAAAVPHFNR